MFAVLASLVNTAKLNGVNPEVWLADVLERSQLPTKNEFFLVRATDFIERSTTLESTSIRPSSRKAGSPLQ